MALIEVLAEGAMDANGQPAAGGTVDFYLSQTSIRQTVYTDALLTTPHANPATLDGGGRLIAYTDQSLRLVIKDVDGNTLQTLDDVMGGTVYADRVLLVSPGSKDEFTSPHVDGALQQLKVSLGGNNARYLSSRTGAVVRKVRTKLEEVIDVKDFGAVGDGSTQDLSAIMTAINALPSSGGALYFPAGTYVVNGPLNIAKSSLTVYGDGGASIIKQDGHTFTLFNLTGTHVTMRDLYLQGDGSSSSLVAVGVTVGFASRDVRVEDVTFSGTGGGGGFNTGIAVLSTVGDVWVDRCRFEAVYGSTVTGVPGLGVSLVAAVGCSVTKCHFYGNGTMNYGVFSSTGTSQCIVADNLVDGCNNGGIWIEGSNCNVSGNIVSNTANTTGFEGNGIVAFASSDLVLAGNQVYSSAKSGIALLVSSTRNLVTGNLCKGNTQHGILVDGVSTSNTITGNTCHQNTEHGLAFTTNVTGAGTKHGGGVVSGNLFEANGKSGAYLQATSYLAVTGNYAAANSTTAIRTYPAFDLTTFNDSGTQRGGDHNSLVGNVVREVSGTYEHLTGIRMLDGAGAEGNFSTTYCTGNDLYLQSGGGGTPSTLIRGAVESLSNLDAFNNMYAKRAPLLVIAASFSVPAWYSGYTILCDTSSADMTLTLPDIGTSTVSYLNGQSLKIVKQGDSSHNLIVAASGTNKLIVSGSEVSSTLATAKGAALELLGFNGKWYALALSPTGVSTYWT